MPTALELLETEICDDILVVDLESRSIIIPKNVSVLGVEADDETRILHFKVPRHYCEVDLAEFAIRVNYKNAKSEGDMYIVTDAVIEDDWITFDWVVGRHAFTKKGNVVFNVCLKDVFEGIVRREFNTTVAILPVLEGLETGEEIAEEHLDIFEQLREELASDVGNIASEAVSEYIEAHPEEVKGPKGDAFKYEDFTPEQLAKLVGPTGSSIKSITRTSGNGAPGTTDTYTIAMSDGNTSTFKVYNGKDGSAGSGSGDMSASMYDPQSKRQDIFKYVDDAVANIDIPDIELPDDIGDMQMSVYDPQGKKRDIFNIATTTELGLVMVDGNNGIGVNTENGNLFIKQASNNEIDGKEHSYKPITPENLDYAVKAGLVNNANELSDSERTSVLTWLGAMNSICQRKDDGDVTDLLGSRNGRYIFSNAVAGMPIENEWWFVDVLSSSSTDITVVAYPILTEPKMYVRTCANNVWGAWHRIITENEYGNASVSEYFTANWLQTTADNHRDEPAKKIAVLDGSGWIYYRTPAEILSDIGAGSSGGSTFYEAAIGTDWTEDENTGVKSQTVAISGVTDADNAHVEPRYTGDGTSDGYATFVTQKNQFFTCITNGYAETVAGGITFHIFGDAPTVSIPVLVEVK